MKTTINASTSFKEVMAQVSPLVKDVMPNRLAFEQNWAIEAVTTAFANASLHSGVGSHTVEFYYAIANLNDGNFRLYEEVGRFK